MNEILSSPLFGILISLLAFNLGCSIYSKTKLPACNPLFIAQALIIIFLLTFNISFEDYNKGGQIISFFLGPATVVLAVPLYKKLDLLKKNAVTIISAITLGSTLGIISVILLSKLLSIKPALMSSLVPKSVTVPIGVEISKQLNGIPAVTVVAIIVTGIIGAIFGPTLCKLFKIRDRVAIGIAIGTSSHALGTTKALELGETEGAMSSLSIGVAGLITVFLAPALVKIFHLIF